MKRIEVTKISPKRAKDRPYWRWTDPITGKPVQRIVKARTQRAEKREQDDLEDWLNRRVNQMSWFQFYDHFCETYLEDMSAGHQAKCRHMASRLFDTAKLMGEKELMACDVGPELVLRVESEMRKTGIAEATVASNMASLWAILSWGMDARIVPEFRRPRKRKGKGAKRAASQQKAKGRSLTLEEIERIEAAVKLCCKPSEDPEPFLVAMTAMRMIGLRRSDAWLFRWDPDDGAHYPVRLHTDTPAIVFCGEQKSGNEEEVPLTPDATTWLRSIEKPEGWVCRTRGRRGEHRTPDRLGRVIAEAGKKANVMVKRTGGKHGQPKYASAHDLRRTFASTWQHRMTLTELARLTRHSDIKTLANFYADAPSGPIYQKLGIYAESVSKDLAENPDR